MSDEYPTLCPRFMEALDFKKCYSAGPDWPHAWEHTVTGLVVGQYARPDQIVEYVNRVPVRNLTIMSKALSL